MDMDSLISATEMQQHHIVKADEVDQTGTDISPVPDEQLLEQVAEGLRPDAGLEPPTLAPSTALPIPTGKPGGRPDLRRGGSVPPPPSQPPPPAPGQQHLDKPPDSLSLVQLRRLVQDFPKVEQRAYAFEYADCEPFPEELEEWFQYSEFDRAMLFGMKSSFEHHWRNFCQAQPSELGDVSWIAVADELRKSFVTNMLAELRNPDLPARLEALETICYLVTGVWALTAGIAVDDCSHNTSASASVHMAAETLTSISLQLRWIEQNVSVIQECDGLAVLLDYFCRVFGKRRTTQNSDSDGPEPEELATPAAALEREANLILTALYIAIEVGRRKEASEHRDTSLRDTILALQPNLLVFLVEVIARLRWDESANIPLTRIVLLFWKSLLLFFGGSDSLKRAKADLEPQSNAQEVQSSRRMPFLTASPLDYHLFRQEITSKYPAYNPPPPILPLELENKSILPPLPHHPSRLASSGGLFSGVGPSVAGGNGSILHQSVHIATPAPSPPPSPIGPGGKTGKKQNYQTNQNFPFMYPPLGPTSNDLGGKGTTELQDALVGKKWQGSDVPASIIEAGNLFSSHVKMTRAMRQLWEERERFMKYDRGWTLGESRVPSSGSSSADVADDLDDLTLEQRQSKMECTAEKETDDEDVQRRLDAVESFYTQALPHLQSITIVFLKIILTNVSATVTQAGGQNCNGSNGYGGVNGVSSEPNAPAAGLDLDGATVDELDSIRLREITGKAVSGSLLLLLKWLKRSHILKFEYMTQLLLDSNYLPLILKMFAHQDVDQAVAQKHDRKELGFFRFCHVYSNQPPMEPEPAAEEIPSEDEAIPPPILRRRPAADVAAPQSARVASPEEAFPDFLDGQTRPEVDELGYPTAPPPKEPITTYSFRNFFSAINYLHIMQKITRDKAHRCLLLVQYKSSTILRKGLKIPDPHLRHYTLKLFKSQVPYCGRKWRQSNMRVITAIYLYCRPELRDDWLAGSDIDAEVEEALPLEQALRGLTHWWHLRRYRDVMGGDEGTSLMEEERDFFVRELEAMGWGYAAEEMMNGSLEEPPPGGPIMNNGTEWDGQAMQMEGW